MKKVIINKIILAAIFAFVLFALLITPSSVAKAETTAYVGDPYSFTIRNYDVAYNIDCNRRITVQEQLTVEYTGTSSTGIYRDIPINAGDKISNIKVSYKNGSAVEYSVIMQDVEFITLSIGDQTLKRGTSESYSISYLYHITRPTKENDLYLNVIGYGWDAKIYDVDISVSMPKTVQNCVYFVGRNSSETLNVIDGRASLHVDELARYTGITFNMNFKGGTFSDYYDFSVFYFVIISIAAACVIIIVVQLKKDTSILTPVVNFTAPNDLDPLAMGKLIDNSVNADDITSMIFYWASKGYVKLNFENENDPIIIKIVDYLPDDSPEYERTMFEGMFIYGDRVATSSLTNKFYVTSEKVKAQVNAEYSGKLYDKKSRTAAFSLAALSAVVAGVVPLLIVLFTVSTRFLFWPVFFGALPAMLVYLVSEYAYFNRHKYGNKKTMLLNVGAAALGLFASLLYGLIVPPVIDFWPLFICAVIGFLPVPFITGVIKRKPEYVQQLNQIIGFRNFILFTEKDKLEAMINDNPQLYYEILPYAQILGVSDAWEDKFTSITIAPPTWLYGNYSAYDFIYINRVMRYSRMTMTRQMNSRPSSSGASGRGGFGGGGGGGHGGGGGRGR